MQDLLLLICKCLGEHACVTIYYLVSKFLIQRPEQRTCLGRSKEPQIKCEAKSWPAHHHRIHHKSCYCGKFETICKNKNKKIKQIHQDQLKMKKQKALEKVKAQILISLRQCEVTCCMCKKPLIISLLKMKSGTNVPQAEFRDCQVATRNISLRLLPPKRAEAGQQVISFSVNKKTFCIHFAKQGLFLWSFPVIKTLGQT